MLRVAGGSFSCNVDCIGAHAKSQRLNDSKKRQSCPGWESNPHEEKSPEDFKHFKEVTLTTYISTTYKIARHEGLFYCAPFCAPLMRPFYLGKSRFRNFKDTRYVWYSAFESNTYWGFDCC